MIKTTIIELDVRPILESGVDPFETIMNKLKEINDNDTLLIINTFEPVPLLNILAGKGYSYNTERPEKGIVHTFLRKENVAPVKKEQASDSKDNPTFEEIEIRYKGNMVETDVRDLEMPLPMVTILEEIEKLEDSKALYVHHKKLPQYLLPELKDRGYSYVYKNIDESNLKFIIFR
jgi:uncharacterized protein (DUF2249 family)